MSTLPSTLSDIEDMVTQIRSLDSSAELNRQNFYIDPKTGYRCIPTHVHLNRGRCCGNLCRHCPYGWSNVTSFSDMGEGERVGKWRERVGGFEGEIPKEEKGRGKRGGLRFDKEEGGLRKGRGAGGSESSSDSSDSESDYSSTDDSGSEGRDHSTGFKGGCDLNGSAEPLNVPYTRTGDFGQTSLPSAEAEIRISKTDALVESMGSVDELCSHVGLLRELCPPSEVEGSHLENVCERLFDIGSLIAGSKGGTGPPALPRDTVKNLEGRIDELTRGLPELSNFVLPFGGGRASSQAHVCRSVTRRAERDYIRFRRSMVVGGLVEEDKKEVEEGGGWCNGGTADDEVGKYLNRLSDYFFQLARKMAGGNDVVFKKRDELGGRRGKG
ncbi:hypothetical protein TrCOL_g1173 [Triparma columacea]|uniref:Cobalamin adenosyltransferase-like domain-containing protein n=1 Tax=Triparma columacea TaxID=722753 RepID=A0A9W7GN54_9STRA|nr:hypothetical protein TrCOL_g1173 [Triparma columacea]